MIRLFFIVAELGDMLSCDVMLEIDSKLYGI